MRTTTRRKLTRGTLLLRYLFAAGAVWLLASAFVHVAAGRWALGLVDALLSLVMMYVFGYANQVKRAIDVVEKMDALVHRHRSGSVSEDDLLDELNEIEQEIDSIEGRKKT